jgi:GNAT superfamily N-acetyltransferase
MTETAHAIEQITIEPMKNGELPAVIDLLARALLDNPSSVGMFGPDPGRRLRSTRALYSMLMADMAQPPLVAGLHGRIVGAAAVSPPETCFFYRAKARVRRIRIAGQDIYLELPVVPWRQLAGMLRIGWKGLGRAAIMGRSGTAHDPAGRHWHIELVGVEPDLQGQGIGRALMEAVLRQTDAAGEPAYLETDTPENVAFYRHRGFEVTGEARPLDVHMWYMERPAPCKDRASLGR